MKVRLRERDTSTAEAKEVAFTQVWMEYDPEVIRHYFSHRGGEFETSRLEFLGISSLARERGGGRTTRK
jgi:predicted kinase